MFGEAGIDALITIGGDGSLAIGRKLSDAGSAGDRRTEDDRQRPGDDRCDVRIRHCRRRGDRGHRPPLHDCHITQPGVRRRGHGPLRRLDRPQLRGRRRRPRHPDPRDPVRPRQGRRRDRESRRPGAPVRDRGRRRGRVPQGRRAIGDRQVGRPGRTPRWDRCSRWPPSSNSSPARRSARWCSVTCCAVERRRRSIVCSACDSEPQPCAGSSKGHRGVMVALQPPVVTTYRSCRRSAACVSCRSTATRSSPPATSASRSATSDQDHARSNRLTRWIPWSDSS